MPNNKNYCIIMAGGVGSRFWPLSKSRCPKQFLDIFGTGKSFIRATYERLLPVVPSENFLIVTGEQYRDLVLEHIPELAESQILCEPIRRNTAPCIAYATYRILSLEPEANVIVAPSDHMITNEREFISIIEEGLEFVDSNMKLLTIGIKPTRPETGYGYIQIDTDVDSAAGGKGFSKVKTFTEKPDLKMAGIFLESGEFYWNSGIFIWSVAGILNALKTCLPDIDKQFMAGMGVYGTPQEEEFIRELYPNCQNISIDYGVMEKSDNVYVRAGDFGWNDIGTWSAVYQNSHKDASANVVSSGNVIVHNTSGSIIRIPRNKVAVVDGLEGYIVALKDDTLLICPIDNEQNIRNYVEDVKYRFGEDFV